MRKFSYKNTRINTNNNNNMNHNIYYNTKKNIQKTVCNNKKKYWTKRIQCCDDLNNNSNIEKANKYERIQNVYKDNKSLCGKNYYNHKNRKRIQNKNGNLNENYNYSSSNYLHKKKQLLDNNNLKRNIKKYNTNKPKIGSNYTQKISYTEKLISDIKKTNTQNVEPAMYYTNTNPKNPYVYSNLYKKYKNNNVFICDKVV